jgi:hypothetical protein
VIPGAGKKALESVIGRPSDQASIGEQAIYGRLVHAPWLDVLCRTKPHEGR